MGSWGLGAAPHARSPRGEGGVGVVVGWVKGGGLAAGGDFGGPEKGSGGPFAGPKLSFRGPFAGPKQGSS